MNDFCCMKLIQYNEYSVSIVVTDGLVLQHQGISNHSAGYTLNAFPAVYGLTLWRQDPLDTILQMIFSSSFT